MNKSIIYIIVIASIILVSSSFLLGKNNNKTNNENIPEVELVDGVQQITLGIKNYNYYPDVIKVKEGVPVSISLDSSVYGCYRYLVIRDFGINTNLRTPEDTVEFTPDKKGSFRFACTMGMGVGTLIVE